MRHSRHFPVPRRAAWLALAAAALLAGCGGGGDDASGGNEPSGAAASEAALAVNAVNAAPAARPGRPNQRGLVHPVLRPANAAAASRMVRLKCTQEFANRARQQAQAYGDVLRQRRLADLCAQLPAAG